MSSGIQHRRAISTQLAALDCFWQHLESDDVMYLFCGERFIAMAKISYGYYDISVNLGDRLDRSLGSYTDLNRALVAAEHIAMDENPIIIQALMTKQKETDEERKQQMLNEINAFMNEDNNG